MKTKDEFDTERTGDSGTRKERIKKVVRKLWGASRDFLTRRHGLSVKVMLTLIPTELEACRDICERWTSFVLMF